MIILKTVLYPDDFYFLNKLREVIRNKENKHTHTQNKANIKYIIWFPRVNWNRKNICDLVRLYSYVID